jgi:hypothetical protein
VRKDYEPGVLAPSKNSASELAARDASSRERLPGEGPAVAHQVVLQQDR